MQSSFLMVGNFIASLVIVAPGGIGVVKAVVAALASLAGIGAAIGFLAAAVGRIVRLVGLALLAGGLLLIETPNRQPAPSHSGSD